MDKIQPDGCTGMWMHACKWQGRVTFRTLKKYWILSCRNKFYVICQTDAQFCLIPQTLGSAYFLQRIAFPHKNANKKQLLKSPHEELKNPSRWLNHYFLLYSLVKKRSSLVISNAIAVPACAVLTKKAISSTFDGTVPLDSCL